MGAVSVSAGLKSVWEQDTDVIARAAFSAALETDKLVEGRKKAIDKRAGKVWCMCRVGEGTEI